jgi:WD40 repeat protein
LGGNGCINSLTPSAETAGPGKDSGSASRAGKAAAHPHRHQIDHQGVVPIQAVDVSDDSRTLVAISSHGTVFVWDPSRGALGGGHHHHPHHHPHHHGGGDSFPTGTAPSTPFTEEDGSASGGGGGADALGQSTLLKPVTKFRAHAPGYYCLHGKISPGA